MTKTTQNLTDSVVYGYVMTVLGRVGKELAAISILLCNLNVAQK
ncbi:MAG TPA: hypothetical protein PLL66_03200 [Bacteroidales bacterium]|nr:hypothetical protein [Bacteroidales bacterium]